VAIILLLNSHSGGSSIVKKVKEERQGLGARFSLKKGALLP